MIGVFVTIRYGENFDERTVQKIQKIAESARALFEGDAGAAVESLHVQSQDA